MFKTFVNLFSKAAKKYAGYSQPSLFDELDFSSPAKDDYSSKPKHVKGNPRENHKYIERKPNPNKPGEFIYIYEMPDGSRYESEQDGEPSIRSKVIDGMFKPTDQFFSLFSRHKTPSLFDPEEPETAPKPKPVNPEPVKDLNEIVEATPKKESSGDVIQDYLNSKQAGKTYRDLNERVRGSRKEAAAIRKLMALDILNLDTATQYERINKKLVLPEFDPYARKEAGESAGATYIKMKLYEAITSRPANSQVAREIYVKFVPAFMEEVYACTDYEEIHKLFDKYFVKAYDRSTNRVVRKFNDNAVQKVKEVGVNGTDDQLSIIFGEDIFGKNFLNLLGMSTDSAHKHRMLARQYEGHDAEKELAKKIEILNKKKDEINNLTEDTVYQKILAKYDRRSPDLAYELSRNNMFEKYGNFSLSFSNFYPALNRMPETERNQMFRELAGIQLERDRKAVSQLANEDDLRELYSGTSKAPDWSWLPDKDKEAEQSFQLESEDEPEKKEVVKEFPKLLRVIRTNGREVTDEEVTVENLQNLFGYNSVQFGNWVKDHEAREHVKHFIASMKDMEDILGIDIKKINETGGLNIAFGARGKSKALAHYEPMRKIINLTKTKGDGTIAHEWAHFFDHLIGGGDPNKEDTKGFATNAKAISPEIHKIVAELMDEIYGGIETKSVEFKVPDKKPTITFHGLDPIRIMKSPSLTPEQKIEELVNTAQNILDKSIYVKGRTAELLGELIAYHAQKPISLNIHEPNSFYENSKAQQNKKYYTAPHELFARAFESYIEDKCAQNGIYNNYLVSDNSADKENVLKRNTKVYPQGNHRQKLNKIFDRLIEKTKQVYGVAKEPDTDSKRVNEVIDYTDSADGSLFNKSVITTEETTMFRKLQNLCKAQRLNHEEINRKLNQNLTEMLQKARKIKYTADDYSFDFPHDFSDIKDNLFDGMEKDGLRLEPAHSNPNVRRYHKIDQAEVQKEASEHPGTFDKIQNNEITTPEELGAAIAEDHKEKEEKEKREAPKPENHMYGRMYKLLDSICPKPLHELEPGDNFKLKSDGYMDFNIDVLYRHEEGDLVAALSHYHEQDGDMMADPDMQILIDQKNGNIQAATFQQDGWGGGYREVFHNFPETKLINMKEKEGQNKFLKMWLKNIKDQGHKFQEPEPVGKSLYQTMRKSLKKKSNPDEEYPTYGEIDFQGLTIVVENKPGTVRSGTDPDGEKWKTKMFYPYGYIKGTKATDGEGVDVYVGKDKASEKVFIIHQRDPENNKYDEDKVMLGFNTKEAARDAYLAHYDSYKFLGNIIEMNILQFREKLKTRKGKMIKSTPTVRNRWNKTNKKERPEYV